MSSDIDISAAPKTPSLPNPFGGAYLVFRYHMLQRRAWRDLVCFMFIVLMALFLASRLSTFWGESSEYSNSAFHSMSATLVNSLLMLGIALPFIAAVLGGYAVPAAYEFEITQSALLSKLKPIDIVVGRILAGIWPVTASVLASLAFWLFVQLARHFLDGGWKAYLSIFLGHTILLTAVILSVSLSFLFGAKTRPGRNTLRGISVSIAFNILMLISPLIFRPETFRMRNPVPIIQILLLMNPLTALANCMGSGFDLLRAPVIYDHTSFHDYNFHYPNPIHTLFVFISLIGVCLAFASVRLRRAYR